MQQSALNQKIKITVNKQLWEVLSGHVTASRRSKLPVLTVGTASSANFNRVAIRTISGLIDKNCVNIYRLQNGMLLLELCDFGMLKLTKKTIARTNAQIHFGSTILKKYMFAAGNKKDIYHFYLHQTDKPNLFVLKELQNSWE